MSITLIVIALFVAAQIVCFILSFRDLDGEQSQNDPAREAAILDFFRP